MLNLYQLVAGAHGGQGLASLAQQFGLSRSQADGAVQALMPALSAAFTTTAAMPGGLGTIAGAMTDEAHRQAYTDPAAARNPDTQRKGAEVAGAIFGNGAILDHVVRTAAQVSGVPVDKLQAMLPAVTSLILGGVASAMHQGGMGGLLGQLASGGGLGGMLERFGGGALGSGEGGGLPGMLGNMFSSMFGAGATPPGAASASPAAEAGNPTAALPPMMQAGLDQLSRMFQPGVAGQPGQFGNLADTIAAAMGVRR